jgi:hypothetical protein
VQDDQGERSHTILNIALQWSLVIAGTPFRDQGVGMGFNRHNLPLVEEVMSTSKPADVSIGKFDILATYTYARALRDGMADDEAKVRGMVVAIMGAQARTGRRHSHADNFQTKKDNAERKKKTTITAASFDRQVADKMGKFFDDVFLPAMKKLVKAGLSYDEVKRALDIPSRWGAKITGQQFQKRAAAALEG